MRSTFISLGLIALTFFVFSAILGHPFIYYDDESYITKNPMVLQGLSWPTLQWAFTTFQTGDWQPLVWISFILTDQFFGLNAAAFHGVNLTLHILNILLVFFIFQRLTKKAWAAAFLAAFFAIHPLRVESVAWISERKDVLSGFFWWLTIGAYLEAKTRGKKVFEYLTILFFAFAIMSKPIVVSLPIILLLLDYWPLSRIDSLKSLLGCLREKLSMIMMSVFSCIMASAANGIDGIVKIERLTVQGWLINPLLSYWLYIKKTLWPVDLAIFYPFPARETFTLTLAGICLAGLVLTSVWVFKKRKKSPHLLVGWAWYLIALFPVIGFIPISYQAIADRYTYLPHIGLGIMVIGSVGQWHSPSAKRFAALAGVAAVICWAVLAKQQVGYWVSPLALNQHAVDVIPNNYIAHGNLGYAYFKKGNLRKAEKHFRETIRIRPQNYFAISRLATTLATQERYKEAEELFLRALTLRPKSISTRYNLGSIYSLQGDPRAESYFLDILKIKKDSLVAKAGLAQLYIHQGKIPEAEQWIQEVLKQNPHHTAAHYQMGFIAELRGDRKKAIEMYEFAAAAKIPSIRALIRLGAFRAQEGKTEEGKQLIRRAIKENPYFENAYIQLANILLREKNYEEASILLQRAVERIPQSTAIQKLYLTAALGQSQPSSAPLNQNPFEVSSPKDFEILLHALGQQTSVPK